MKTVKKAPIKQKKSFWACRIDAAETHGMFTDADVGKAADWVTCACGKQDKRIPRIYNDAPLDRRLRELGVKFDEAVYTNKFSAARCILAAIEKRAAIVLHQTLKKRTKPVAKHGH